MVPIVTLILFCSNLITLLRANDAITDISINDEVPAGQMIMDLSTKTVFSQHLTNAKSTFRLIPTGPFTNYLKIEPDTGKLFARKKIDRDTLCEEIELCCTQEKLCTILLSVALLTISKLTVEPFTQQLQIQIGDINDHKPVFIPDHFNISIEESRQVSSTILLPLAIDRDSREYTVKTYRLLSHDHGDVFALDTQLVDNKLAAYLRLRQKLDREQIDRYSLTVIACDGGDPALTGTLEMTITVADVNDNPPVFENTRPKVSVTESQLFKDPIVDMTATDKDIGENAEIIYSIDTSMSTVGSSEFFRVDLRTGSVYVVSALDYEKQQIYKLVILATNREQSAIGTATATLTVNVINTNDEKPSIIIDYLSNRQDALITENVAAPIFVGIISVTDKDIGIAGKVSCQLSNHQDVFDLRQSSQDQFKVYTRQQFDREVQARYSLLVLCQDQGIPPLSSEATVSVIVLDDNDNTPEIKSAPTIRIRENKPTGTVVARLSATDKDDGLNSQLEYEISDANNVISSFVRIDQRSGVIYTTQSIDKESKTPSLASVDFVLTVSDGGTPRLTTTLAMQLIIEDENDNQPQFVQQIFRFTLAENEPPNYRLGQIEVTDADEVGSLMLSLKYAKKSYRKCPFSLEKDKNSYWLVTTKTLDWEEEPLHELLVIAADGSGYKSHTSSATVLVTVSDTNDHKPHFIFPRPGNNTAHTVSFRNKPGYVIITVSATDKDSTNTGNGKFHFSITADDANLFSIDPNSGRIKIQRQMVLLDIRDHIVMVKVEDHGSPPLSSEMRIKIRVQDLPSINYEKSPDSDPGASNNSEGDRSLFTDKEAVLVFGLVFILLILTIAICFILYVRHMKGWLHFLPDVIGICHIREQHSKSDQYRKEETFLTHNIDTNNLQITNYPSQKFMVPFPPSYCQSPEPLIKTNRDCYEVLKIGPTNSPLKLIPGQSYNDLVSATMVSQYHDNYRTLHHYPTEYAGPTYAVKTKSLKPINSSNWNISCPSVDKPVQIVPPNSQNSYAVTFPSEESTFV